MRQEKRSSTLRCVVCRELGHNKRTCLKAPPCHKANKVQVLLGGRAELKIFTNVHGCSSGTPTSSNTPSSTHQSGVQCDFLRASVLCCLISGFDMDFSRCCCCAFSVFHSFFFLVLWLVVMMALLFGIWLMHD